MKIEALLGQLTGWNTVLPYLGTALITALILFLLVHFLKNKNAELLEKRYAALDQKQNALSNSMNEQIGKLISEVDRYRKLAEFEQEKRLHQEREYEIKIEMLREEISALRVELKKFKRWCDESGIKPPNLHTGLDNI